MRSSLDMLIRAACSTQWAVQREKLEEIGALLAFRSSGGVRSEEEIRAAMANKREGSATVANAVGVLPVYGVLSHRMDLLSEMSGGTSIDRLQRQFDSMVADPNVGAIVLDIDSPGGSCGGIEEFARSIHEARDVKPVVAVANSLAASAAYWLASQATEVVAAPSSLMGSVGVYSLHVDVSRAMEASGMTPTFISAGKYKVEGNEFEPLSDEARSAEQALVDEFYGMFLKAISRGRGVSVSDVRKGFGEGRVVPATQAVSLGMADRIETLAQTIARVGTPKGRARLGGKSADTLRREIALSEQGL